VDTSRAFYLIAAGLFKKVVISSYLASNIVDEVFADPTQFSSLEILIAVYAYAVQIYADFSGYTDIAIGIALLLGFNFPQNFDSPYAAVSLQDFWRRWHMTLSRWLRDYLYIPLGGSRRGVAVTYRNILLTMLLGGLWHGAGWTFVAWGLIHGVGLCTERVWRDRRGTKPVETFTFVDFLWRRLLTFHVVCFAWIFFRAETFGVAWDMITGLFTGWGEASPLVTGPVLLAIAVGIGSQYLPPRVPRAIIGAFSRLNLVGQAAVLALALMVTQALGPQDVAPFIYFQF
jgi:D-alanyl-lipoteichoic acid acyltransferase DltB (MBOAT superfamily)